MPTPAALPGTALTPLPASQRIAALDVVRGFALLGICLMNIEFFNRPTATVGKGMPAGLQGADWLASYFVAYFVAGKFWTIFSLLFGMGFALMLSRAQRAGRRFLPSYLRRIAALAVFGILHHILLFAGDILFSYAVAALCLLLVLYANLPGMLLALALAIGAACIPGLEQAGGLSAYALAFCGLVALYLRSEERVGALSAASFVLAMLAILAASAAALFWLVPTMPAEPRWPLSAAAILLLLLAVLAQRWRDPIASRPWRAGVAVYLVFASMRLVLGALDYVTPPAPPAGLAARPALNGAAAADAREQAERLQKETMQAAREQQVQRSGSYAELLRLRTGQFIERAQNEAGFAPVFVGLFLLGSWFIRAGVMEDTAAHLPLFRTFACVYLPIGLALGIAGSLIARSHAPGAEHDGFALADALLKLGNLPACLGYVGMIVLMLHSSTPLARVKMLAPFGRMALSNYLLQSLLMSLLFLGHGMGLYGMGRAAQLGCALALLAAQIVLSQLWLSVFRYGPAEWLWRALTYLQWPPLRHEKSQPA